MLALCLALTRGSAAQASRSEALTGAVLKALTFDQRLDSKISAELKFRDEHDQPIALKECLAGKPAVLILGYSECPMLCNLVLNGVVESWQEIKPRADSGAQLIFVSINPRETAEVAAAKKRSYLKRLARAGREQRWHFLRGEEPAIRQLASEVGFHYEYDASHNQFAHPSGIVVLTPDGRVSRYLFGVSYPASELQQALAEAALKRTGSRVQALLILCSQFVPLTGKFSGIVLGAVRLVALATLLGLVGIAVFHRRVPGASKGKRERQELT